VTSSAALLAPVLRLRSVDAAHEGVPALHGVDVTLKRGSHILLIGPNGSGKSTLLSVLAGVHPLTAGDVDRAPGVSIGVVVQRSAVPDRLPVTVRDVVSMGRWAGRPLGLPLGRADRAIVDECLEALDIADLARRPLSGLSGGQRQRALVAQGLARRADLLLLDEPTSGVDEGARRLIRRAVSLELARGATVVEATHDASDLGVGSAVVRLVDGRRVG